MGDRSIRDVLRDFFKNGYSVTRLAAELQQHGHGDVLTLVQQKEAKLSLLRAQRADIDRDIDIIERSMGPAYVER